MNKTLKIIILATISIFLINTKVFAIYTGGGGSTGTGASTSSDYYFKSPTDRRNNYEAGPNDLDELYRDTTENLNKERADLEEERKRYTSQTVYNIVDKLMNGDEATRKEYLEAHPISDEVKVAWQNALQEDKDGVFKAEEMKPVRSNMLKYLRGETTQNNNGEDVSLTTKPAEELQQDPNEVVPETKSQEDSNTNIYDLPKNTSENQTGSESIQDVFDDANRLTSYGGDDIKLNDDYSSTVSTIYSILLALGTAAVVIMGGIIGVKYIFATVEGKAEVKSMLIPYVMGTVMLYGAFGIWKIGIDIFSNLM